jgi:hypothetical protein
VIAASTTPPPFALGFAAMRTPYVTSCAPATRCDAALRMYLSNARTFPAFRFDAKDVDAAIDVIVGLHLFAIFLGRAEEVRLWDALLGAALSIKRGDPMRHRIESFRRVAALAPSLGAPHFTARMKQLCDALEDVEVSKQRRMKLRETYELIESDSKHVATLAEDKQSEILERLKRVTRATEKEQRLLKRIGHRILGRTPRVLRPTKLRSRARRAPRRPRRATACRRQQTDSGGSADGSGDPPPAPPSRSIVATSR